MADRTQTVGGVSLFLIFLTLLITLAFPGISDCLSGWLFHKYAHWFHDSSRPVTGEDGPVARWYLVAIVLNAVSIFCAVTLTFAKDGLSRFDGAMCFIFGLAVVFTFGSSVFVERSILDVTVVTSLIVALYVASDLWGMHFEAPKGSPNHVLYWLPFWCLDFPMLVALAIFLVAHYLLNSLPLQFYEGVGIGAMVFGSMCYIALMTVVVHSSSRTR
jgi:hypothetical protein